MPISKLKTTGLANFKIDKQTKQTERELFFFMIQVTVTESKGELAVKTIYIFFKIQRTLLSVLNVTLKTKNCLQLRIKMPVISK